MFTARDYIRFWSKVAIAAGGCAEWTGATYPSGYGDFYHEGRNHPAQRIAWEMVHGPINDPSLYVLHRCDNRRCVEPDHLFLGRHQDNMDDMLSKGRKAILTGADHPSARLTPEQVAAIRADSRSQRAIAKDYGISKTQVGNIKRGKQWQPRQWPEVRA